MITIVVALYLLAMLERGVVSRLWRLVRWLLLPVMVLHLLFTPGTLLLPQLGWSPTIEGVRMAAWLSLHLVAWLLSAWLLMALITMHEWQWLLSKLPYVGRRWSEMLLAIPPLLQGLRLRLQLWRYRWQLEQGRWRDIPGLAVAVVGQVLAMGDLHAESHWLQGRVEPIRVRAMRDHATCSQSSNLQRMGMNLLLIGAATAPLLVEWMV